MERNKRGQLDKPRESPADVKVNAKTVKSEDEIESDDNEVEVPVNDSNSSSEEQSQEEEHDQEEILSESSKKKTGSTTRSSGNDTEVNWPVFQTKLDFTLEMQRQVRLVIGECIQVLKKDPREYHPFYLTVHKWIRDGLEQSHISDSRVDLVWEKCDGLAVSEFQKSTEATSTCKLEYSQPPSEYLDYILNQNEDKSNSKVTPFRHIQVKAKWKRHIADDPLSFQDIRSNLKARLTFFECSKTLTSPSDCCQMNILWNRLLASQLFTSTQKYKPRSKAKRKNPQAENQSSNEKQKKVKRDEQQLSGRTNEAETLEERLERLKRDSNYHKQLRAAETPEQRQNRLKRLRESARLWKERKIRNETPEQKEERQFCDRVKEAKSKLKKKMKQAGNFNEKEYKHKCEEIMEKYKTFKTLKVTPKIKFKLDKKIPAIYSGDAGAKGRKINLP